MERLPSCPSYYSCSVYSERDGGASPDRPGTPSSFECHVAMQGGSSSAVGLLPSNVQTSKHERLTDTEEYRRAGYHASFLQAENAWLRRSRKSGVALYEGSVEPSIQVLARGTDTIHDALAEFYIAFMAVEQVLPECEGQATVEVGETLRGLTAAFEKCREGLDVVRSGIQGLKAGGGSFAGELEKANRSYEKFFGISYGELERDVVVPVVMMQEKGSRYVLYNRYILATAT